MIDYKYYATEFCRELQKLEKETDVSLETIQLIRRFKIQLGYSIPESVEEGTGSMIRRVHFEMNKSQFFDGYSPNYYFKQSEHLEHKDIKLFSNAEDTINEWEEVAKIINNAINRKGLSKKEVEEKIYKIINDIK